MEQHSHTGVGPIVNGSYASRHFFFDVDREHAKHYDGQYKNSRTIPYYTLLLGVILIPLALWLYAPEVSVLRYISLLCMSIGGGSLILGLLQLKNRKPAGSILERGVLNPGIIAEIYDDGVGLLILAEVTKGSTPKWGLYSIKHKGLPTVHNIKIGEQVPVTCTFTHIPSQDFFNGLFAIPISWGTNSKDVIQSAIDSIPEIEWNALEKSIDRFDFKDHYINTRCLRLLSDEEIYRMSLDRVSG